MKNVLQLIDSFDQGGSERQAVQLTRLLHASGAYKVHVACLNDRGVLKSDLEQIGFRTIPEFPLTSFLNANTVKQINRFAALLKNLKIDVLHTHDFYTNIFGMTAGAFAGVPARIASRRESSKRASHKRLVERGAYRLAGAVVANCESVREQLIAEGVPENKIVTVYNGINLERFSPRSNFDREKALATFEIPASTSFRFVGIVANLRPVKDHQTFLRAMQLVQRQVPEAAFLIAGEGELLGALSDLSKELGIADRTFFLGQCRVTEDVLALSEVCVLSSTSEGFSNSILEYMAAGRPVVVTDVGGAREVVNDETGYLVPAGDYEAMAKHVTFLLQDAKRARWMGEKARDLVVDRFSSARQLEQIESLYRKLLDPS
jgi:glycosyltransferase involved in cell wall biosynthesis